MIVESLHNLALSPSAYCSVLQCVSVRRRVCGLDMQLGTLTCDRQSSWVAWASCSSVARVSRLCVEVCYNVLQCVAGCCSVVQCVAVCCSETSFSWVVRASRLMVAVCCTVL